MKTAWALVLGFSIFRFVYSGTFPLVPDETNYWQWSRYLDWGYHDQSPMIAWLINLSTAVFGHTEIGVRFPSVIAMAVISGYLVVMARRWFDARVALQTAILTQSVLAFNVGGLLATPDGIQAAAWAGASYHVARGYEEGRWPQWLMAGVWFGFGMLSKYTMVIFLPGAYLYGLLSKQHRNRLASIRPYAGVLIGCLMFAPVIWWNAKNGWNSVRHVAYLGGANQGFDWHVKYFGDYLASQAALLSPLLFILLLLAWYLSVLKALRGGRWIYAYLFFTSFTMFFGFAVLSLHSKVYGNWPGAGYITVSVLVASFFGPGADAMSRIQKFGRRLWPWAVGMSYAMTALLLVQTAYPILPLPADMDRIAKETSGWPKLGKTADGLMRHMPNPERTFLFGLKYQHASELAFYTPGKPYTVSINKWARPNVYDYWWTDEQLIGWDAVGITGMNEKYFKRLKKVFERVDPPVKVDVYRKTLTGASSEADDLIRTYHFYRAYGFKGGLRWVAPDRSDIRVNP